LWSRDDVLLHGRVADLGPWLESCRLSIAPLRFGAGVKGKLNTAMAHGLPVVATSVAAEAMHLQDGRDVLLADDAESFAAAIVRVYADAELWGALSAGGLAKPMCATIFPKRRHVRSYASCWAQHASA
ncbi:glycosyltransferase family 4 protein, partial [Thiomonas sp.]|uniref:glycosyltransferase family 4 protein n=1 Tax=Thiomonas sp. TaxID=2047785 RepID=UPI00258ECE0B